MKRANPTFRVLAVVLLLASLGTLFLPWISPGRDFAFLESLSGYDMGKMFWDVTADWMKSGNGLSKSTTADILTGVVMVLLALTAVLGLVLAARGLRWGAIPYASVCLVFSVLLFFYFLRTFNNVFLRSYGFSPYTAGIGLILFPLLAIAAALCLLLPKQTTLPGDVLA